jgi:hypothetical protein
VSYCLLIKSHSWSHGGIPLAWPPTHGAARRHESSRDSFQLRRACSSSMASAMVERTVRRCCRVAWSCAVLCLGCGVVSGMGVGVGVRFSVDGQTCQACQANSLLGWKRTAVAERVAACGWDLAVRSSVQSSPGLALRHACWRSVHLAGVKRRGGPYIHT